MKAKHLLAALALPVVFSACNQEELAMNNVEKEVVGTPIGYDLDFTASFVGPSTRITNDEKWEQNEKIGMGWISDTENSNLAASANGLYSNHPLYNKGGNGFKSETMIYEGLYIASYPYQETKKIQPLKFDLAKQSSFAEASKRYSARWNVSETFMDLRKEAAGLGNAATLKLVPLTNLMKLNIKLGDKATLPEDFKVMGVTLVNDANSKLVNSLTLAAEEATVAKDEKTLVADNWIAGQGDILVTVGEAGYAIDKAKGLDVFVQMGAFDKDDATTLKIHTNYGDAEITTGDKSVTYKGVEYAEKAEVSAKTFAEAVKALSAAATTANKTLGSHVIVNVTLNHESIKVPETVTKQDDLDRIINLLDKLGRLGENNSTSATIEFSKSDVKANAATGIAAGDVILTDLSGLNKLGGSVTFQKSGKSIMVDGQSVLQTPTNVFISGELNLKTAPSFGATAGDVVALDGFSILKDQTLTVAQALDLTGKNITVNAGATLINKGAITAATVTTAAASPNPAIPAGLYISEKGADASKIGTFTNNGLVEWRAGTLVDMGGDVYANIIESQDLKSVSLAFEVTKTNGSNTIYINSALEIPTQLSNTELPNIKKMVIKGDVSFGLTRANAFTFADLAEITVEKGSFSLTGGDESEKGFFIFETNSTKCDINLESGTKLNLAAGTKLDLKGGSIKYKGASITNYGYIAAAGASNGGTGVWSGNALGTNPKP